MPYRSVSLEDFARMVGMHPRDVRREADHGRLPGHKVGGLWRFHRVQIHDWLEDNLPQLDSVQLDALDRGLQQTIDADVSPVVELIGVEGINLALSASTKSSVLRELVCLADRTGLVYDAKELLESLREREAQRSTAMPGGFAIPHPCQPLPYATADPLICVARIDRGIAFGAPDGALTYLFFLICSHESNEHLHVLARLIRMLDKETITALMAAESPQAVLELMMSREGCVVAALR